MKIEPIVIEIKDYRDFREVAFLLDREALLEDLDNARRIILNLKKVIPYEKVEEWISLQKPYRSILSIGSPPNIKIEGIPDFSMEDTNNYAQSLQIKDSNDDPKLCYVIRDEIKDKHHLNDKYDEVLLYALVAGKVTDKELKEDNRYLGMQNILRRINQLFEPLQEPVLPPDVAGKIKRDRDWYWLWIKEKTKGRGIYDRIVNIWNERCPDSELDPHDKCEHCVFDKNIIEQAVSRYQKTLR